MKNLIKICFVAFALCFVIGGIYTASANYQDKTDQQQKSPSPTASKQIASQDETKKTEGKTIQPTTSPKSTIGKTPQIQQSNPSNVKNIPDQSSEKTTAQSNETAPTPTPIVKTTPSTESWLDDIWALLSWALLGFAGLTVLGLTGWFVYYVLTNIRREREAGISRFNEIRAEQRELSRQIKQLGETAKLQNVRVERQQSAIQSLQKQSSEAGNIGYAAQPQQFYEQSPVNKPEPQFPVSAEDYLNKVRQNGQKASADLIGGMLVQDPNKNEEFLIVKDNALADGLFYAVPSFNRFSTRSDYLTYYQNYYACENPSGGTVWILAPTTVRRIEGGWKLEEMGELEIRN